MKESAYDKFVCDPFVLEREKRYESCEVLTHRNPPVVGELLVNEAGEVGVVLNVDGLLWPMVKLLCDDYTEILSHKNCWRKPIKSGQ